MFDIGALFVFVCNLLEFQRETCWYCKVGIIDFANPR